MKLGVTLRISRSLEQRCEDVVEHLLKIAELLVLSVHGVEARHLHQKSNIVGDKIVVDNPRGQLIPLVCVSSVDRHAPLSALVLG